MADRRKLQAEIDRCLKKVNEGVEIFHEIWEKAQNAATFTQREKHEAELKKEIKRLQRLRDNVKSWLSSSEVIDKTQLQETRRLIESLMEKFKVLEREMKTKAYSKEGLSGVVQKVDPVQKEKDEVNQWLVSSIHNLNLQVDQFECEIENTQKSKKAKDKDRIQEIRVRLEKHRFHIKKLETILRRFDNDTLEVERIKRIMDDVNYYIESCLEDDFEGDDYLYEELGLDDGTAKTNGELEDPVEIPIVVDDEVTEPIVEKAPAIEVATSEKSTVKSGDTSQSNTLTPVQNKQSPATKSSIPNSSDSKPPRSANVSTASPDHSGESPRSINKPLKSKPKGLESPSKSRELQCREEAKSKVPDPLPSTKTTEDSRRISNGFASDSLHGDAKQAVEATSKITSKNKQQQFSIPKYEHTMSIDQNTAKESAPRSYKDEMIVQDITKDQFEDSSSTTIVNNRKNGEAYMPATPNSWLKYALAHHRASSVNAAEYSLFGPSLHDQVIPPVFGVPARSSAPSLYDRRRNNLETSCNCRCPPVVSDQVSRGVLFGEGINQSTSYPIDQVLCDDTYLRLSCHTLFFVFYHMEGTKAQLCAAKALKHHSWRFHTELKCWFRRHNNPEVITETYEHGSYNYFDYSVWEIILIHGFSFNYKFLENSC